MSNKHPVISTSIIESLPKNPAHRSLILRALERSAVVLGFIAVLIGTVLLASLELTGQSPEMIGKRAADDLFRKTQGSICTGQQQHSIESGASQAFINRLTELCVSNQRPLPATK